MVNKGGKQSQNPLTQEEEGHKNTGHARIHIGFVLWNSLTCINASKKESDGGGYEYPNCIVAGDSNSTCG